MKKAMIVAVKSVILVSAILFWIRLYFVFG